MSLDILELAKINHLGTGVAMESNVSVLQQNC